MACSGDPILPGHFYSILRENDDCGPLVDPQTLYLSGTTHVTQMTNDLFQGAEKEPIAVVHECPKITSEKPGSRSY